MSTTHATLTTHAPDTAEQPSISPRPTKGVSRRARQGLAVAALVAAGSVYWLHAQGFEQTDDAQVDGDITSLAPRVAGSVVRVLVTENQAIRAGDLLAELDPRELEATLAGARAELARARAELATDDPTVGMTETSNAAALTGASSEVSSALATLNAARRRADRITAELTRAQATDRQISAERDRAERLFQQSAVPLADLEAHQNAAAGATAGVEALKQELAEAVELSARESAHIAASRARLKELSSNAPGQLEIRKATVDTRRATLALAAAAVEQAELQLSFTRIVAPVDGTVARKAVAVGDHVAPGQQLLAIAQVGTLWVTANLRETQLSRVRPGQAADVYVDALDAHLRGTVDSIGGTTGARLSLFPPENAAGNFVKVVQRIPVRIRLEPGQPGLERLRPGMSVEPKIRL
ncbi:MAG: HlyD family secretion protein [Polyangiaceae bacterium]